MAGDAHRQQGPSRPAHNAPAAGAGLSEYASRLLSRSTRFPGMPALGQSATSTAVPLFYSAREGHGHEDEDGEDEGSHNMGTGRREGRRRENGWFSRGRVQDGIEEEDDGVLPPPREPHDEESPLDEQADGYRVDEAYPYAPGPSAGSHALFDYASAGAEAEEYDDPFRRHLAPSESSPPRSATSGSASKYPLPPRHVMASQALAAMMAEAAGGDDGSYTEEADEEAMAARKLQGEGWKMYSSNAPPYRDDVLSPSSSSPKAAAGEGVVLPQVSHSLVEPPSHPHPLLHPRPPEIPPPSATKEGKRPQQRETVYVYPSQARDVGANRGAEGGGWSEVSDEEDDELIRGAEGVRGGKRRRGAAKEEGARYRDAKWLAGYLLAIGWCCWEAISLTFLTSNPSPSLPSSPTIPPSASPSSLLLSTLPLLIILATLALAIACTAIGYLLFVQRGGMRHLVRSVLVGTPLALLLFSGWCWAASFTSSSAIGERGDRGLLLRIVALVAMIGAVVVARVAWEGRKRLERTVRVLELCGTVVVAHPPLVVACLFLGLVFTLCAIPFLSLLYRLLSLSPSTSTSTLVAFKVVGITFVYAWTLATLRAIQRLVVAGVVASWYFSRHDPSHPPPLELVVASLTRATGPSLGTAVQAGFWVALLDSAAFVLRRVRDLTRRAAEVGRGRTGTLGFPWNVAWWIIHPLLAALAPLVSFACALVSEVVGGYAVVYAGVTGVGFTESARRVGGLLVRNGTVGLADNLLVKLLLTLTSLTIAFLTFLLGLWLLPYILPGPPTSSSPSSPSNPSPPSSYVYPLVALCCGLVPFWTVRFVGDVVANAADTLFCCWNVDLELKVNHSAKAQEAFGEPIASNRRLTASVDSV